VLGHDVAFGVRAPERGPEAVAGGDELPPRARVVDIPAAARDADVIVLATPWAAAADALRELGATRGSLDGKPLLDTTNPLGAGFRLDVGPAGESGAERIQAMAPKARVVKIFNTTGFNNMADPVYDGAATAMFYAGDDSSAKDVARQLAAALGFAPFDVGPLVRARELEHFALVWIALATGANGAQTVGRNFAFRVVRR
jgi:hypothetical protein